MQKIIYNSIMFIILEVLLILAVLLIITPEKTKQGDYTNIIKYWTDNTYLKENFK